MPPQSAEFDTSSNGSVINLAGLPVDKLSAKITPVSTASVYPELRYMGSKRRLLPWIFEILSQLEFKSVADTDARTYKLCWLATSGRPY
jgi:adenine-specific DNA-methyltransferase